MAKLVFLLDGHVVKEHVLDKSRISIGRRASNDIHIDNLAISGEHAVVVTTEDSCYIEDLSSTNGTVVNHAKIKKHLLTNGDLVRLGKYKLQYLDDGVIHQPRNDGFESTVLVADASEALGGTSQSEQAEKPVQAIVRSTQKTTQTAANSVKWARLTILNGDDVGSALLLDKSIVKIGQPNEQLALVTKRTQGYFISHVIGDGGLLVNGKAINTHVRALRNHDEIEMLGVKMKFSLN